MNNPMFYCVAGKIIQKSKLKILNETIVVFRTYAVNKIILTFLYFVLPTSLFLFFMLYWF